MGRGRILTAYIAQYVTTGLLVTEKLIYFRNNEISQLFCNYTRPILFLLDLLLADLEASEIRQCRNHCSSSTWCL